VPESNFKMYGLLLFVRVHTLFVGHLIGTLILNYLILSVCIYLFNHQTPTL